MAGDRAAEALHRACLGLVAEPEAEDLPDRIVDALRVWGGAAEAALWIAEAPGRPLRLVRGGRELPDPLVAEGGLAQRLASGAPHVGEDGALYLPLAGEAPLAVVRLRGDGPFPPEALDAVRTLAGFAAAGLRQRGKVARLRQTGLKDRETGAYHAAYFIDYAVKEIDKARRYNRRFSLVALQVDNLRLVEGAAPAPNVQRALITAVQSVVRESDVLARVGEDGFHLLLPETDAFGARSFVRRALAAFTQAPGVAGLPLPAAVTPGVATWPEDGDDFDELLACCRRRQHALRSGPYRRLHLEGQDFWALVATLLGTRSKVALTGSGGRRGGSDGLPVAALAALGQELQHAPELRALVYFAAPRVDGGLPLLQALTRAEETSARIYLLGRELDPAVVHPAVTAVPLPGETRLERHRVLLVMGEQAGYAWLEGEDGASFHTSDPSLVEALVARLQEAYDLQRQY